MIRFFRKIRQSLFAAGNFRQYALYAIGEIVLVVIGILIALQINNWNTDNKTRAKELVYLENIRQDLTLNLSALDEFITVRNETVNSAAQLLEYFEGKPIEDLDDFNAHNIGVMVWFPFIQNANTYNELVNSGNFAIISNKKIKNELQNMQTSFGTITFIENEMQQDYERYLYEVFFNTLDLNTVFKNIDSQQVGSETTAVEINRAEVDLLLTSKLFKNGLVLAKYNSTLLVEEYQKMIKRTTRLIELIDLEVGQEN